MVLSVDHFVFFSVVGLRVGTGIDAQVYIVYWNSYAA